MILAIDKRTNATLMRECAVLGYLPGVVLDMTYNVGAFWREYQPSMLIAMDIDASYGVMVADAMRLPFANDSVDTVVFDPPYKLNGTSTGIGASALDHRYGVHGSYVPAAVRHELLLNGTSEACRVARQYVLVKCADQISSGRYNPQTYMVWQRAIEHGCTLIDSLHVLGGREQPAGTRQLHARRNYSTLMVFGMP